MAMMTVLLQRQSSALMQAPPQRQLKACQKLRQLQMLLLALVAMGPHSCQQRRKRLLIQRAARLLLQVHHEAMKPVWSML